MKSKLKFIGTNETPEEKVESYLLNRTVVGVSRSNKSNELNKEIDGTVLRISLSHPNGKPPQADIDYVLSRFGLDTGKHYFSFIKDSYHPGYNEHKDIYFYEQILEEEK